MPVTQIKRDFNEEPYIVRMVTTDTLATVGSAGYLTDQAPVINDLNSGTWEWLPSDLVLAYGSDGASLYTISTDLTSLIIIAPGSSGITPAQIQDQAFTFDVSDTGIQDNYEVALTPVITSYADGLTFSFIPATSNISSTPTIDAGPGPITIIDQQGNALNSGQILFNIPATVKYYNGFFYLQGESSASSIVTPADIQHERFISGVATNIGDAYTLNLTPALLTLPDFTRVSLTVTSNNTTTTPTLEIDGLGAFPILTGGTAPNPNDINVTLPSDLIFLNNNWHLLNPNTMYPWASQDAFYWQGGDSGALNALVINIPVAISNNYMVIVNAAAFSNTGPATLEVNYADAALGALPIVLNDGSALVGGEILAGFNYVFLYNSVSSEWQLINPFVSSGAGVTPEDIQIEAFISGTTTNIADAYSLTRSPPLTPLVDFTRITIIPSANNTTTTPTLAVDGAAPSPIVLVSGALLSPDDLQNSQPSDLIYIAGTWYLQNPATFNPRTIQEASYISGIDTGIINAYELSIPTSISDISIAILNTVLNTNSGASTFDINFSDGSLSPLPIVLNDGSALVGGEIAAGQSYLLLFKPIVNEWQLVNPSPTGLFPVTAGATGTVLRSNGTSWVASTATFADTYTANNILYASASDTVSSLASANSASLVTNSTGVPTWSGTMVNGEIIIGSTGATPTKGTITAGSGISVTNGAGSITIANTAGALTWVTETTTSRTLTAGEGVIVNAASICTATIPATTAVGDTFSLTAKSASGFRLQCNTGQVLNIGSDPTSSAGSITTTGATNQSITIVCITANTTFNATSIVGNFNIF